MSESTALTVASAFPAVSELDAITRLGTILAQSQLVPDHFKGKREDVVFALMTARGLGIDPMVALNKGFVIKGKFDIEVSVKIGMVMSRLPGFDHEILEQSEKVCRVRGWIEGKTPHTEEFTIERAQRMGLLKNDLYRTNPEDMLYYRAMARLLKKVAPHAVYNMPLALDEGPSEMEPEPQRRSDSGAEVVDEGEGLAPVGERQAREVPSPVQEPPHSHSAVEAGSRSGGAAPPTSPATPPENPLRRFINLAQSLGFNAKHGPSLLRLVNELLKLNGKPPVKSSVSLTREECESLYDWLMAKYPNGKPAPAEPEPTLRGVGATDAGVGEIDAEIPDDDGPRSESAAVLSKEQQIDAELATFDGSADALIRLCDRARMALKDGRKFYDLSAKGTRWFVDRAILMECQSTKEDGSAKPVAIDAASKGVVAMLARGVLEAIHGERR